MQMDDYKIIYRGALPQNALKALILLHGRGGTAEDMLSLADTFADDRLYVAALQAPNNTWYPHRFMEEEALNEPWLSLSVKKVKDLIEETAKQIPLSQIYLMGFSQGACLALETAARFAAKYGGVVAFTGGLIGRTLSEKNYQGHFEGTKVFIGNSDKDPHVPVIRSEQSKEIMEKLGAQVTLKVYKGIGHTINDDEIFWVKKNMLSS